MNFKKKDRFTSTETEDDREICKYGSECYQKNPNHLARFQHPKRLSDESADNSDSKKTKFEESSQEHRISESSEDDQTEEASAESTSTSDNSKINGQIIAEESSEDLILISKLTGDTKAKLKELYVVEFPNDFFSFYEFCRSVNSKSPKNALKDIDLELVGPFDLLAGDIKSCTRSQIIRHYRYYFDPPEFYTILKSIKSELHFGYFFDDPDKPPIFIASNDPKENCTIKQVAVNIFGAVNIQFNKYLKVSDPFKKMKLQKLHSSLTKWVKEKNIALESNNSETRERNSKSSTKTFHSAGIVVPYDTKTDVGYRPLAENNTTLKELLTKIENCDLEEQRKVMWGKIQHVITFAEIAADECDFGTPLELGINMFCRGHECFHRTAEQLMTTAYELLGRKHFANVISTHLKHRLKGSNLNFATKN